MSSFRCSTTSTSTNDPIEEYLDGLRLLEGVADDVDVVVPGHGSVGSALVTHRARIELDRGVPARPA